jgi:hypothetical protein
MGQGMNSWINLNAVGQILGLGLLLGAGLPALFAVGLRALSVATPDAAGTNSGAGGVSISPSPVRVAAACVCFAIVLAAIAYGIYLIVSMS